LDWNWKGGRRLSSSADARAASSAAKGWSWECRTEERVGVRYIRETLMSLAQINVAQAKSSKSAN